MTKPEPGLIHIPQKERYKTDPSNRNWDIRVIYAGGDAEVLIQHLKLEKLDDVAEATKQFELILELTITPRYSS